MNGNKNGDGYFNYNGVSPRDGHDDDDEGQTNGKKSKNETKKKKKPINS